MKHWKIIGYQSTRSGALYHLDSHIDCYDDSESDIFGPTAISWVSAATFLKILQTRTVTSGEFDAALKVVKRGTAYMLGLDAEGEKAT